MLSGTSVFNVSKGRLNRRGLWKSIRPYVFVAPAISTIAVFIIYPVISQLILSFTDWNLIRPKNRFIGLENYADLFASHEFYEVLSNTFIYTFSMVAATLVLALILSFLLTEKTRLNSAVQSIMFLPHITALISVSLVFMWLMDPQIGVFNAVLRFFGFSGSRWLESSKTAMLSVVIVNVWKIVGYYSLVILTAIKGVPNDVLEAARLDGSSRLNTFMRIILPMISPTLFFLLVVNTMTSFNVFDTIDVMTGGGPAGSTNVLVYYVYEYAFTFMRIGYACAASMVLLVIVSLITFMYFRLLSDRVHYQ